MGVSTFPSFSGGGGFDPAASYTATGSWDFTNASFKLSGIPANVTAFTIFYDTLSKELSYGPAPGGGSSFAWTIATPVQAMAANTGYFAQDPGLTAFTLPTTCALGDAVEICGDALTGGGWTISQGVGQSIQVGSVTSLVGVGGSVSSTLASDGVRLVCVQANTRFIVQYSFGNLSIV